MLPVKGFKSVSPDEVDILNVPEDSKLGYIHEVDLEYPQELRDKHNLYPLAPEHVHLLITCSHLFSGSIFHRFVAQYGKSSQIFTTIRSM